MPLLFPILINSTTFIDAQADYSYNCYAAISESLFLATSLREILLALRITPTPKAPPIISLPSKVSNFTDLFSKEKASALLPYYSSQDYYICLRYNPDSSLPALS
ncbi:hypothetical protein L249_4635 [Ophiocordyceps polyrhachis-furcata BCC 54312]|uniref:Uncharacterized protein n=1 Tax=Ophiocordyceps polyrhachis-furcata BCC 54312 TaxID=1330021 RepID=A0A367L356_9HYPO|nr:hypothetical protein L249_4635 [Ophiocordyceps polyrhachis-furcata BCC 54312]